VRIYQPTQADIGHAMTEVRAEFPQLGAYADRAEQILADGRIFFRGGWCVWSQQDTDGTQFYRVNPFGACDCRSYISPRTPTISGYTYCKHMIALNAYMRILRYHLRHRWIGSADNVPNMRLLKDYRNTFIAIDLHTGRLRTAQNQSLFVELTMLDFASPTFASNRDAHSFARWLAQAAPVPTNRPDRSWLQNETDPAAADAAILPFEEWIALHGETIRNNGTRTKAHNTPASWEQPAWMKDQF